MCLLVSWIVQIYASIVDNNSLMVRRVCTLNWATGPGLISKIVNLVTCGQNGPISFL